MENPDKRRAHVWVGLLLGVFALAASASDGRIPIGTVPYTISAGGSYYLTADLVNSATSPAITIAASNVSLDLEGHYVWEQSASATYTVYCSGYTNVRISNGLIRSTAGYGVYFGSVPGGLVRVTDLTLTGATYTSIYIVGTASPQPTVLVENNTIANGAGNASGIGLGNVTGGSVVGNQVTGAGTSAGYGIITNPASALLISDNVLSSSQYGIWLQGGSSIKAMRNNASLDSIGITVWGGNGVEVQQNLMANNNTGLFFNAVTNCVYRDNTAQGNVGNYNIPSTGVTNGGGND